MKQLDKLENEGGKKVAKTNHNKQEKWQEGTKPAKNERKQNSRKDGKKEGKKHCKKVAIMVS